jgi:hypothetical protein
MVENPETVWPQQYQVFTQGRSHLPPDRASRRLPFHHGCRYRDACPACILL